MPEAGPFGELVREFFAVWFRYHPDAALELGACDTAALPASHSDGDQAALAHWLESLIVALQELDYDDLDARQQIDAELMFAQASVEHRELLERDWRHRDPLRYLPLGALHRLTLLRPRDLRERLSALLDAIPDHLRRALTQLKPMAPLVPPLQVRVAVDAARDGRHYLRALTRSRWLRRHCRGTSELENLAEAAGEALRSYAGALQQEVAPVAAGSVACGEDHLRFLLRHRHLLDCDPSAIAGLLDRLATDVDQRPAAAVAPHPAPGLTAGADRDRLRTECSAIGERLERLLETCPPPAPLRISPGPVCPGVGRARVDYVPDLARGEGVLYLPDADEASTAGLADAELRLLCSGLGWGGEHGLIFTGGMPARAFARRLAAADTLRGGWSLYLERRLFEQGGDAAERDAALRRRRRLLTAARIDLALHLGRLDTDAALAELRADDGAPRSVEVELAGIVRHPGDALAAVLGWWLLEAAEAGCGVDAGELYRRLFPFGPVPLPLAIRRGLGDAVWVRVRDAAGIGGGTRA